MSAPDAYQDTLASREEETVKTIQSSVEVAREVSTEWVNPDDDLELVSKIEDAVQAKELVRRDVIVKLDDEYSAISAELAEATRKAQRPEGTPSAAEHEQRVRSLEQEQYATHKALNEEQANNTRKDADLARARTERDEVKKWEPAAEGGDAGKILRIDILRSLGFSVTPEGNFLVRNEAVPDVHAVNVSEGQNPVETANRLWELAGAA